MAVPSDVDKGETDWPVTLQFETTLDDHLALLRVARYQPAGGDTPLRDTRLVVGTLGLVMLPLAAFALAYCLLVEFNLWGLLPVWFAGVFLFVNLPQLFPRQMSGRSDKLLKRAVQATSLGEVGGPTTVTLTASGITSENHHQRTIIKWEAIDWVGHTEDRLFIGFDGYHAIAIPRRAFASPQAFEATCARIQRQYEQRRHAGDEGWLLATLPEVADVEPLLNYVVGRDDLWQTKPNLTRWSSSRSPNPLRTNLMLGVTCGIYLLWLVLLAVMGWFSVENALTLVLVLVLFVFYLACAGPMAVNVIERGHIRRMARSRGMDRQPQPHAIYWLNDALVDIAGHTRVDLKWGRRSELRKTSKHLLIGHPSASVVIIPRRVFADAAAEDAFIARFNTKQEEAAAHAAPAHHKPAGLRPVPAKPSTRKPAAPPTVGPGERKHPPTSPTGGG